MKYTKPEVTLIDGALAAIQGVPKVGVNRDSMAEVTYLTASAYEADE